MLCLCVRKARGLPRRQTAPTLEHLEPQMNHSHLIQVDARKREIVILRIDSDGTKTLFTSTTLPDIDVNVDMQKFKEFAQELGENILLDSPAIQKIYGL